MNKFLETVDKELDYACINRADLSRDIGIAGSTVRSWFFKDSFPPVDAAYRVAKRLNCSVEYLVTGDESLNVKEYKIKEPEPLFVCEQSPEETQLLLEFNKLSDKNKRLLVGFLDLLRKEN